MRSIYTIDDNLEWSLIDVEGVIQQQLDYSPNNEYSILTDVEDEGWHYAL